MIEGARWHLVINDYIIGNKHKRTAHQADKIVGHCQQQSPHRQHAFDPPMIEGARCHLVINDYIIGSKHKRTAHDVLKEKAIFRCMQAKYKWTDTTIQGIDWAGHKKAVSSWTYAHRKESLTKSPPTFLRKFLYGWLATGKMVARYNAALYPKECQSCQHLVEDQTHFLRCRNCGHQQRTIPGISPFCSVSLGPP
jgi:hypothetical protein